MDSMSEWYPITKRSWTHRSPTKTMLLERLIFTLDVAFMERFVSIHLWNLLSNFSTDMDNTSYLRFYLHYFPTNLTISLHWNYLVKYAVYCSLKENLALTLILMETGVFLQWTNYNFHPKKLRVLTLMTPLGISGSFHCTTTVLELTGLARTSRGGLPGAGTASLLSPTLTQTHSHLKHAQKLHMLTQTHISTTQTIHLGCKTISVRT